MTTATKDPVRETGAGAAGALGTAGAAARRSGVSRFSTREWLVLLAALAVAVIGTAAAALNPDLSAAASPTAVKEATATATVRACPATQSVEAAGLASRSATAATATPSAATTRTITKTVVRTVRTKAAASLPALVTVGTSVNFGTYGDAPLQWRVLYADDDELVLLSRYVLSAGAFQSDWEGTDASRYGASEVRAWLLGDFAAAAFTVQQSAALLPHTGGPAGTDRVFLLNAAEVERYLPKATARTAAPHVAAGADHIGFTGEALSVDGAYASWWLADAASDDFAARLVEPGGKFGSELVYYADIGVRPAIRVDRVRIDYTLDALGGD